MNEKALICPEKSIETYLYGCWHHLAVFCKSEGPCGLRQAKIGAQMPYSIRDALEADLPQIAELLDRYMGQNLGSNWRGSLSQLRCDFGNQSLRLVVAEAGPRLIGFAAWLPDYDLHWCVHGVQIIDLYVVQAFRGLAVGPALLARVAASSRVQGAQYLRGNALADPKLRQLYGRFAVNFGGNTYNLSGRAFEQLAELAGKSPKQLVRGLPTKAMNYQSV